MFEKLKKIYAEVVRQIHMDLAIDLDSRHIKIYPADAEEIINRESVVISIEDKERNLLRYVHAGDRKILVCNKSVKDESPLKKGWIKDYLSFQWMMKYILKNIANKYRIGHPKILVSTMEDSLVGKYAIEEALSDYAVVGVSKCVAAIAGSNVTLSPNKYYLVVYIGDEQTFWEILSGTTELHGRFNSFSLKAVELTIQKYVLKKFNIQIGDNAAYRIRQMLFNPRYVKNKDISELPVKGRELTKVVPKEIVLTKKDIREHLYQEIIPQFADSLKTYLKELPADDILKIKKTGIIITGPGVLEGVDKKLSEMLKISVTIMDDPENAAIKGAKKILENPKEWENFCWKEIRKC